MIDFVYLTQTFSSACGREIEHFINFNKLV